MKNLTVRIPFLLLFFAGLILCLALLPARTVYAERPYTRCSPKEVHPIYWKATIRGTVKTKVKETKAKITLNHGKEVIVTKYKYKGVNTVMLSNGTHCNVHSSNLNIYDDACTPGDYAKATKADFVNSKTLKSKTKWLIWVSTDRQSLNLFKGSNKNWKLYKVYQCSTGMANWSTPLGKRSIKQKIRSYYSEEFESWLNFFLEFGGSGIHVWPGPHVSEFIGKKPCSHACVRLRREAAIWCFKHIPVGTLLYVY